MSSQFDGMTNKKGDVMPDALIEELHITKQEFATAIGLRYEALIRIDCHDSKAAQQRIREVIDTLKHIEPWAGSLRAAWSWYRSYAISALGGLTAEQLILQGRSDDLQEYLSYIAENGYA